MISGRRQAARSGAAALLLAATLAVAGCAALPAAGAGRPAPSRLSRPTAAAPRVWPESVQMVTGTVGWALLHTASPARSTALALGRTNDGGRSWTLLTPRAASRAMADDGTATLLAVSTRRAWLAVAGTSKTEVFSTSDAGRTWQSSAPLAGAEPVAMSFPSTSRGWLLESLGETMGQNPVLLYRTTDAGLRWSLVARSGRAVAAGAAASGIPVYCDKTGVAFESAQVGWITAQCISGYSVLVSADGGRRWTAQRLPVTAAACQPSGCLSPPAQPGPVTYLQLDAYPAAAYLLATRNAGLDWRVGRLPRGAGPYPRVRFFGPADGIAVSAGPQGTIGRVFYRTADGGRNWTPVPQGHRFGSGASFDFVTVDTGFAWVSGAPMLYETTDSGRTWMSFTPRRS